MNIIFCNKKAKPTALNRSVSVRRLRTFGSTAARLRKTSLTAGTLCENLTGHYCKIIKVEYIKT